MGITNFAEFQLNESLNNPTNFYLTDDTKLPSMVRAAFDIDGTEYVVSIEQVKFKNDGLYQVELMRVVSKKGRKWSFKGASHIRVAMATMLKVMEATIPFVGPKLKGFVIPLPKKVADRGERFAFKLIKRSYITSFRAVPVIYDPEADKGKERYVVVVRKPLDPKQVFSGTVFKNYEFDGSINASALETIETKFVTKKTVSITPSKKFVFGKAEISLDLTDPEMASMMEDMKDAKGVKKIVDVNNESYPAMDGDDESNIHIDYNKNTWFSSPSSFGHISATFSGVDFRAIVYSAAPNAATTLLHNLKMGYDDNSVAKIFITDYAKDYAKNHLTKGKIHSLLGKIGKFDAVDRPSNEFALKIVWYFETISNDPNYYLRQIEESSASTATYLKFGDVAFKNKFSKQGYMNDIYSVRNLTARNPIYGLFIWCSSFWDFYNTMRLDFNNGLFNGKPRAFFEQYLEAINIEMLNKEFNENLSTIPETFLHIASTLNLITVQSDGSFEVDKNVLKQGLLHNIMMGDDTFYSGHSGFLKVHVMNKNIETFKKMFATDPNKQMVIEKNIPFELSSPLEKLYGPDFDSQDWPPLMDIGTKNTDLLKSKFTEEMGFSPKYLIGLEGFSEAYDYTSSNYSYYNENLREIFKRVKETGNIDEKAFDHINMSGYDHTLEYLKKAMKIMKMFENIKPLPEAITVFRYGNFGHNKYDYSDENIEERILKHDMIDPGIISATVNPGFEWTGRIKMKIHIPAGAKVIPMLDESDNPGEEEIILPPLSVIRPYRVRQAPSSTTEVKYLADSVYIGSGCSDFMSKIQSKVHDLYKIDLLSEEIDEKPNTKKPETEVNNKFMTSFDFKDLSIIEKLIRLKKIKVSNT